MLIFTFLNQYLISELARAHHSFHQTFSIGGASWTLDLSKEAVNCEIKHKQQVCLQQPQIDEKRIIFEVEINVFQSYYSFLNHM